MKRAAGMSGSPDVLQRLGRPGFPKGMVVLLVGGAEKERADIEAQMSRLFYKVISCESCSQARLHLASSAAGKFDIVLAEANLFSKENGEGQLFLQAASSLPLVLVSDPGTTTECVWRGIEVGAAEVLEKPLSLLKLQNIWQHVVRKVMDGQDIVSQRNGLPSIVEDLPCQIESSVPSSRATLSSSLSAVTAAPGPLRENCLVDHEASFSGSFGKEGSYDASNNSPDDSHTVDGPLGDVTQGYLERKPAKKIKRSKDSISDSASLSQAPILRARSAQPSNVGYSTTVVGMVHPSWASSQGGNQAFRGSIPPGCVWGTPLNPPPGWQGMFPNGSGPLIGSAASNTFTRCHSAPVSKVSTLGPNYDSCEGLPDLDPTLMVNLTDDLFMGDDFLDCGDNFLQSLGSSCASMVPQEPLLEMPPIGLALKKSESLVNLINQHLGNCQIEQQPNVIRA